MNNDTFKTYTFDAITKLKAQAFQARENAQNLQGDRRDFAEGMLMGYYSIICLLKHQAFVFCIDQKELGLADINPDTDLLRLEISPDFETEEDNWQIDKITESKVRGYLNDTIILLIDQAIEAQRETKNTKNQSLEYARGELAAYAFAASILKDQAVVFKIDKVEPCLSELHRQIIGIT